MGSHKTKDQLEIELNELKQLYSEKCSECDFLTKDNLAKSEAATNACADLKNKGKDLEDARAELKALKEGNKKLADQFYDYRTELVKVRKELADAIEKRDSFKVELEGVRGALNREADLRVDTEKKRRELEQKLAQEHNVAMVQEARATDLEEKLRHQTDYCKYWTDRAFRVEEELRKVKDHDRIAQENFEKAFRRNDVLLNEVNKLQQRWTDTFNPEDEMLGRKVLEWQDINVTMAKHNIENAMVLESELDMLKEYRKVLGKHGIVGPKPLDERLSQSCPEEYMKVFNTYGIDSEEALRNRLSSLNRIKELFNAIRSSVPGFNSIVDLVNKLS